MLALERERAESVCVAVRRGDFVTNREFRALHQVCGRDHYLSTIERMKRELGRPTFVFFLDDIDWVRDNVAVHGAERFYERGDDPVWEKLRMTSNSSFSWWAQYLSRSSDKLVVAPSRWFNNDYRSPLLSAKFFNIDV